MSLSPSRRLPATLLTLLATVVAFATTAPAARAYALDVSQATPTESTEAGAFSDFALAVGFSGGSTPRSLTLNLPKGQLGVLSSAATCSLAQFQADACPAPMTIGAVSVKVTASGILPLDAPGSIYRIPATGTEVARIGIAVRPGIGDKMFLQGTLRVRDDYGIVAQVDDMPNTANLTIIPGFPPAPVGITISSMAMTMFGQIANTGTTGFFFNPSECVAATTVVSSTAYDGSTGTDSRAYTPTNCAAAPFTPTVAFSPVSTAASTPTPFTVTVGHPFSPTAAKVGTPFRTTTIVLPPGVQLSGATNSDGSLVACTDAQFDLPTLGPATCPAGAKVGTVVLDSPLVGDVPGDVFLAQPSPGSGDLIRLFVVAQLGTAPDNLRVKLLAKVKVDPSTGLLTNTLTDLPAQPVRSLKLSFRAGNAPGTRQPRTCGTYTGSASLVGYASATPKVLTAPYVVDQNCATTGRFAPGIAMATAPTTAGAATTGTTTITIPNGDEPLTKVKASLPPGLLANIKGVPRCTPAQVQADSCGAATQIGTVRSLAGQSAVPGAFNGTVALTDAPASTPGALAGLYVRVPVVVGPIVVDTLKIQAAIVLRPDYGIDVISDIPESVRGLQLDQRELKLVFDRPGFMVNPPVCSGNTIAGGFGSALGKTASANSPITVTGCDALRFEPSVAFSASPASASAASSLTTTVSFPAGAPGALQSPAKRVAVTLPEGVSLSASANAAGDLAGCTDAQFRREDFTDPACPAGSAVGTATIETPTVGRLSGSAYLAAATDDASIARVLVDAKSDEFGAAVRVKLEGRLQVDPATGHTKATFDGLPPVGFTSFTLTMRGGTKPVLSMPRACGTTSGSLEATPYSGEPATRAATLTISTDCPDAGAFAPTATLTRSSTAAGASMTFGTTVDVPAGSQELTSLRMALPAGLLGAISSIPACSQADAEAGACAAESRVGTVSAQVGVASAPFTVTGGAYLVRGDDTVIARLALMLPAEVGPIDLGDVITFADLKLRGDYGLDVTAASIPTTVQGVRLDLRRFALSIDKPGFMVNPVTCGAADVPITLGSAGGATAQRTQTLTTDGCGALALDASLGYGADPASPLAASTVTTSIRAAAPGGTPLDAMRAVRVTLPDGVSLSPSAGARGDLDECSPAQFAAGDLTADAACPAGSKVGTVKVTSPMVGDLTGDVFLGAKPEGHFSGVYFQAKAADYPSLRVKIAGTLDVDEASGRLTAAFDDLPQVQVSSIDLTLRGGDAPVLSLPRTCGDFASSASITRHGGGTSTAEGALTLNVDCPDPGAFSPTLTLATSTTQAAADTALTTVVSVPARQQELRSLNLGMPRGLLGRLTVVPQCALVAAQANVCSDASLVGTVTAKVGAASAPFTVRGKVFMTAGSGDAIAGLAFALPAKVGPIDLGTVVTLAKLGIEGNDLQLKISSDAIPTRVKGVPLSIGELAITIDRPGVVLNASSCGPKSAEASFGSVQGGAAVSTAAYQATGCERLDWKPKMDLYFSGSAAELTTKGHPTITTVIEQAEGQGNLRTVDVQLPIAAATDLANINANICESAAAVAAGTCPESRKIGGGTIVTSALPNPVAASIFLVRVPGQGLPGLAIHVRDQIAFDIVGLVKITPAGRVRVTFDALPDTPISKMQLVFQGGAKGAIQLNRDVCADEGTTNIDLTSQHGVKRGLELATNCNGRIANPLNSLTRLNKSTATLAVRPTGKAKGYTLTVANPTGVRRVTFTMPKGFTYASARVVRKQLAVKVTGAGKKVKVTRKLKGRTLTVSIASPRATKVVVTAKPKAVRFSKALTRTLKSAKTRKAFKPTLAILDANARPFTPTSTIRVPRRP